MFVTDFDEFNILHKFIFIFMRFFSHSHLRCVYELPTKQWHVTAEHLVNFVWHPVVRRGEGVRSGSYLIISLSIYDDDFETFSVCLCLLEFMTFFFSSLSFFGCSSVHYIDDERKI